MQYLEKLLDDFSDTPRNIIVHADVLRRGIKMTDDLQDERAEALKSYIEAFEFLVKRGIVPWFTVWTASPLVGGFSEDDPPPTEFYLKLGEAIHELLEKYGLYRDLGFPEMGVDPPTLGLYCYYCYSMQFTRDYPRLIGRKYPEPLSEM